MRNCRPWLDCNEIEENIQLTHKDVGNGLGKSNFELKKNLGFFRNFFRKTLN